MTLTMGTKPRTSSPARVTRRQPRFAVGGRIRCEIQGPEITVPLLNVSRGGFLVRSPIKTRPGDVQSYRFLIETDHHYIFVLRAQVVHCSGSPSDGSTAYLTGLQFLDTSTPVCQRAIEHLMGVVGQS
jgi:hypothetical protein